LARDGYNILIVGRNSAKVNTKLEEIKTLYPTVKTRSVIGDLGQLTKFADYRKIEELTSDIDVAILVLNAGVKDDVKFVTNHSDKMVQDILNVNAVHMTFMAKVFINRLIQRNKDSSAILVVGSGVRALPIPGLNLYCATKKCVYYMCKAMGDDMVRQNKNVKVVCYDSGAVSTNMTEHNKHMISPEEAAERALGSLSKPMEYCSFES